MDIAPVAVAMLVVLVLASCSSTSPPTSTPPTSSTTSGSSAPAGRESSPAATAAPGTASTNGSTPPPAAVPSKASPGCLADRPKPVTAEHVDVTLSSAGETRTYKRYVPAVADTNAPSPLVIDLHGYSEGNAVHTAMSGLAALADKEGFVLSTPLGAGAIPFWNAVPAAGLRDDVQFLEDLIDDLGHQLCIDLARVFVTGLSNGAFMSSLVACRLADKVAAVAPVAGLRRPDDCKPARPVPIVAFHGTADQFVTYDGSAGPAAANLPLNDETKAAFEGLRFTAIPDTLAAWAADEGCAATPIEDEVSASVKLIRYEGCRGGSIVELYAVEGGGHSWPGSAFSRSIERVVGPTTFEIDANQLMWAFFEAHPLAP